MVHPLRYVLWVDPGKMNGWALYYIDEQMMFQDEYESNRLLTMLDRWLRTAGKNTVVGCERFIITSNSSRRPGSVEAIQSWGVVKATAAKYDVDIFVDKQNSAAAKAMCRDPVLRALGWYKLGMPHANDAARHVFRWLADERLLTDAQTRTVFSD